MCGVVCVSVFVFVCVVSEYVCVRCVFVSLCLFCVIEQFVVCE